MVMSERKRLIFTAIAVSPVGIVTGLLLGDGLLPLILFNYLTPPPYNVIPK